MEVNNLPPSPRPMNEPHTPITMDEMNPNIHNEPPKSAKSSLLTLASLLILAGIVGITLFLYIQNRTQPKPQPLTQNQQNLQKPENTKVQIVNQQNIPKSCVNTKVYKSLDEAFSAPGDVCILDLSNQKLTSLPDNITDLKDLTSINLSNNDFSEFPLVLFKMKSLSVVDLSNNKISTIPANAELPMNIGELDLRNNKLSQEQLNKYQRVIDP